MYPTNPYPGYSWSMNHHMGVATERNLQALLWAAETFRQTSDPIYEINNYLVANNILTSNVRSDSQQADSWRDYQQILSELGLIFSTHFQNDITLTPLGLAYVENIIDFNEVMTLQLLRYQYPNGHRSNVSNALRKKLLNTPFQNARTLTEMQIASGIQIRPAVLIWDVLRTLERLNVDGFVSQDEALRFLLPCVIHEDTDAAIAAIIYSRRHPSVVAIPKSRDIQEWFRFLLYSPLFQRRGRGNSEIELSSFGHRHSAEIDAICVHLKGPATFWLPDPGNAIDNLSWYAEYGSVDLSVEMIPKDSEEAESGDGEDREPEIASRQSINLRAFDADKLFSSDHDSDGIERAIEVNYGAGLSTAQHILHDKMVVMIAGICQSNGGSVFDDPQSVDLLVGFEEWEFLIEVKSVTSRNFVKRLRLALGQLLHYEYLRALDAEQSRRKVVALTARVKPDFWCVPFIRDYLASDLLTLGSMRLEINSNFDKSKRLFSNTPVQNSIFETLSL